MSREEPERESTNSPLMKSLVNLMVGISREKLVLPLEEGRVIFVCFPKKPESSHKTTWKKWDEPLIFIDNDWGGGDI